MLDLKRFPRPRSFVAAGLALVLSGALSLGAWAATELISPLAPATPLAWGSQRESRSVVLDPEAMGWPVRLPAQPDGWQKSGLACARGITVGPIENALHAHRGYGTRYSARTMSEVARMGGNWISVTPFGRVWDLGSKGVSLRFEAEHEQNVRAIKETVRQAHARGLRVLMVPHLWVEGGGWRGELDPGDSAGWQRWANSYQRFVTTWAQVAADSRIDLFAVGVELRSWLTTTRSTSFPPIIDSVREIYPGPLTYAGNWDDIEQTTILGQLDVIGINAFYPLAESEDASRAELLDSGREIRARVHKLAERWQRPVMFTEFGYTTRRGAAVRPWEWPEHLSDIEVSERAQADAYFALLGSMLDEPYFAGFFMWRWFSDADDASQEPAWGFSPRGKAAELILREAFQAHWAADGPRLVPDVSLWSPPSVVAGRY